MQYQTVSFHQQQQMNFTLAIGSFTEWIDFYLRSIDFEKQSIQPFNLLRRIILFCAFKLQERCHLARLSVSNSSCDVDWFLKQQQIHSYLCTIHISLPSVINKVHGVTLNMRSHFFFFSDFFLSSFFCLRYIIISTYFDVYSPAVHNIAYCIMSCIDRERD